MTRAARQRAWKRAFLCYEHYSTKSARAQCRRRGKWSWTRRPSHWAHALASTVRHSLPTVGSSASSESSGAFERVPSGRFSHPGQSECAIRGRRLHAAAPQRHDETDKEAIAQPFPLGWVRTNRFTMHLRRLAHLGRVFVGSRVAHPQRDAPSRNERIPPEMGAVKFQDTRHLEQVLLARDLISRGTPCPAF